jgi:hypothetical protein
MSAVLATLWLSAAAQLRLELLLANNTQFRLEMRRWDRRANGRWRLNRERGLRFERSELAVVLKALKAGERQ